MDVLNPKFIQRVRSTIETVVEGGEGRDREVALDKLAERYGEAALLTTSDDSVQQLLNTWLLAEVEEPPAEARTIVQFDYLLVLDPMAAEEVEEMYPVLSTNNWVEIATYKLAESAQERILGEIKSHYVESYADLIEEGAQPVAAHIAAIRLLGSPKTAKRQFRKTYLTAKEEFNLKLVLDPPPLTVSSDKDKPWILWGQYRPWLPWLIWAYMLLLYANFLGVKLLLLMIGTYSLAAFAQQIMVPRLLRNGHPVLAYLWAQISLVLSSLMFFSVIYFMISGEANPKWIAILAMLWFAVICWSIRSGLFIIRKSLPINE